MNRQEREAARTAVAVQQSLRDVLRYVPSIASARSGALYTASTSGPDTNAPIDSDGNPVAPAGYFRMGMRLGSAPIKPGS